MMSIHKCHRKMKRLSHRESHHDLTPDEFLHQLDELLVAKLRSSAGEMAQQDFANAQQARQAMVEFGEYVCAARTHLQLSPAAFADRVGTTEAYLHALEQGLLPRTAIDDHLLEHIAAVVGDECKILLVILGDAVTVAGEVADGSSRRPAVTFDAVGIGHGQKSGNPGRAVDRTIQVALSLSNLWISPLINRCRNLLGRYRNLLDYLQPSRLLMNQAVSKRMIVMVALCSFIMLWRTLPITTESSVVMDQQGERRITSDKEEQLPSVIAQPIVTKVQPYSSSSPEAGLIEYRSSALTPNLNKGTYRIIYTERNAATSRYHTPFIVVDETQLALIEFRQVMSYRWHCINHGNSDLCPI